MVFDSKKVETARKKLEALENRITDRAQKSIVNNLKAISREIQIGLGRFETDDTNTVIASQDNLRRVEDMILGLGPALQQISIEAQDEVLKEIAEVANLSNDLIGEAGFRRLDNPVALIDESILGSFLELDLNRFGGGASATTQSISNALFNQLSGLTDFDDMVKAISDDLENTDLQKHAKVWAMSAITSFENQFFQSSIPADEIGGLLYSGPLDGANRDFCHARATRIFEPKAIAEDIANNPIGGSNIRLPGGFGCRHVLIPVPFDDLEAEAGDEFNQLSPIEKGRTDGEST